MQVRFEFTKNDLIDSTRRLLMHSRRYRSGVRKGMIYSALLAGVVVYALFYHTPMRATLFGLLAAVLSAFLYRQDLNRRIRIMTNDMLTVPGPYVCEVELRPVGVWVRALHRQSIFEWETVEKIVPTMNSVDIFTRGGGGVIVRDKAFPSVADRLAFIDSAKSYQKLVQQSLENNKRLDEREASSAAERSL